jgi:hypothetical protein
MHKTRKNSKKYSKKYSKKKIYGGKITCEAPDTRNVQLVDIIKYINKDVGEIIIHGGKIPDECFTVFDGKRYFKKENFNPHVLKLLKDYGNNPTINQTDERNTSTYYIPEAESETSTSYTSDPASEWHREFHFFGTSTWNNSWVCIAYLKLDNCKNDCGTDILYYKDDICKKINLQASANDFILFRDCKLIHKIPNSKFEEINKPIVRNLYRIYFKTDNNHENCDPKLIKHTKKIDVEKEGQDPREVEKEVEYTPTIFELTE